MSLVPWLRGKGLFETYMEVLTDELLSIPGRLGYIPGTVTIKFLGKAWKKVNRLYREL